LDCSLLRASLASCACIASDGFVVFLAGDCVVFWLYCVGGALACLLFAGNEGPRLYLSLGVGEEDLPGTPVRGGWRTPGSCSGAGLGAGLGADVAGGPALRVFCIHASPSKGDLVPPLLPERAFPTGFRDVSSVCGGAMAPVRLILSALKRSCVEVTGRLIITA